MFVAPLRAICSHVTAAAANDDDDGDDIVFPSSFDYFCGAFLLLLCNRIYKNKNRIRNDEKSNDEKEVEDDDEKNMCP